MRKQRLWHSFYARAIKKPIRPKCVIYLIMAILRIHFDTLTPGLARFQSNLTKKFTNYAIHFMVYAINLSLFLSFCLRQIGTFALNHTKIGDLLYSIWNNLGLTRSFGVSIKRVFPFALWYLHFCESRVHGKRISNRSRHTKWW